MFWFLLSGGGVLAIIERIYHGDFYGALGLTLVTCLFIIKLIARWQEASSTGR